MRDHGDTETVSGSLFFLFVYFFVCVQVQLTREQVQLIQLLCQHCGSQEDTHDSAGGLVDHYVRSFASH